MHWPSFKNKFHPSWHKYVKPFIESKECDEIFKYLKTSSGLGAKIMPTSFNTFRAFQSPLDKTNVVILGGPPYNGILNGEPIATGYYLDCSSIEVPAYELRNFYRGIEIEVYNGLSLVYKDTYNTEYLTKQGVMMLNSALTIEFMTDHNELWRPFTTLIVDTLTKLDIPMIFVGELAHSYIKDIDTTKMFALDDIPGNPGEEWDTQNTFRKVDEFLEDAGKEAICWLNIDCPF